MVTDVVNDVIRLIFHFFHFIFRDLSNNRLETISPRGFLDYTSITKMYIFWIHTFLIAIVERISLHLDLINNNSDVDRLSHSKFLTLQNIVDYCSFSNYINLQTVAYINSDMSHCEFLLHWKIALDFRFGSNISFFTEMFSWKSVIDFCLYQLLICAPVHTLGASMHRHERFMKQSHISWLYISSCNFFLAYRLLTNNPITCNCNWYRNIYPIVRKVKKAKCSKPSSLRGFQMTSQVSMYAKRDSFCGNLTYNPLSFVLTLHYGFYIDLYAILLTSCKMFTHNALGYCVFYFFQYNLSIEINYLHDTFF